MYEVIVLKEGYNISDNTGHQKACGSITLLKGPQCIIVDTGNPWDKNLILEGLKKQSLVPEQIQYVICTNGHSDKIGNLNLFSQATYIISSEISRGDSYVHHSFEQGIPYEIDEDVEVIPTPGHTGSDVSVLVKNTKQGTVAVTGDLFECCEDLDNPHLWQDNSEQPQRQERSRVAVLQKADYIVPGHGAMFQVPETYKKQLRVVMVYEESVFTNTVMSQDYHVWEVGED